MGKSLLLNPPQQPRSRRTLERIVRASLEILEEQGAEGLTVQAIVARAGSSVGSFYARFPGKDELLDYLGERAWREAAARWDAALAEGDWADQELARLVRGAVRLLREAWGARTVYLRAMDRGPGAPGDPFDAFRAHVLHGLEALLLTRAEEIDHADPALAVRLGLRAVLGIVERVEQEDDGLPGDRIDEEASSLLLSYLTRSGGDRDAAPGQVDFFDIWG